MSKTILIAVENDYARMNPVIDCAGEIAQALDATTILFHTYTEDEFKERLEGLEFDSADPEDIAKRNEITREAASRLGEYGQNPTIAASVGNPAEEIAMYVENNGVDHVFLGARRRTATGKAVFGSVSQKVITSLEVPCTVLMEPNS